MAKTLTAIRCVIVANPETGEPTNLLVSYLGTDGEQGLSGIFEVEEPVWTRDAAALASDALAAIKDREGI